MSKIDLSAFEHTKANLDEEGNQISEFVDTHTILATLEESISEFAVVLQNFMADYQQMIHGINQRFTELEKVQANAQTVLHLVAQRTDWMMKKDLDLAKKEFEFFKEQKELHLKAMEAAKEKKDEKEALSVSSLPG
ncbi:hypothetical protein DAPPUDRAFT_338618 [Daphnia pulex]|uniref:Uncharacterized protein n=1 Tax=Daphnia pulex TaxID=6669 RepID=E9I2Z6_DAPPU|nr:hypothetical protein DAPPUDRAFT_338618 [Daphnia pulex]|eukprot:EFX61635.1 hypothetical protein DAPPUDRAFT_338618 [Daphnia pulex]